MEVEPAGPAPHSAHRAPAARERRFRANPGGQRWAAERSSGNPRRARRGLRGSRGTGRGRGSRGVPAPLGCSGRRRLRPGLGAAARPRLPPPPPAPPGPAHRRVRAPRSARAEPSRRSAGPRHLTGRKRGRRKGPAPAPPSAAAPPTGPGGPRAATAARRAPPHLGLLRGERAALLGPAATPGSAGVGGSAARSGAGRVQTAAAGTARGS
ncbi:sterile alpha motif domain-containing protein 1-like [Zonotrichia leucophrys gambelii]|uniref:sterile alpha motif domain-containing protein 1-like n=1 Tax=Zonotrichia leucophrys gambelii TaxID=257770 RepID=UPI003140596D